MKPRPDDGRDPGRWGGVAAWLCLGTLVLSVNSLEAAGDPLTSLLGIRQLPREEAAAGRPVEVEGTVTYYDPGWRCLFIQDRAEAIFVLAPTNQLPIVPGDRIRVTGRTHEGSFDPIVIEPVITKLSEGALPAARKARSADLLDGLVDAQRIEVSGVVRRVLNRDGRVGMDLVTDGTSVLVWVPETDAARWNHLIGGEVRVTGACGVLADDERQIRLIQVFMPDSSGLVVEQSAPTDPFELPQTAIADLLTPLAPNAHPHLLHLAGRVLGMDGSRQLELQDASGQIDVHTEAPVSLRSGQRVQVVGFRSLSSGAPRLEHAWLRSEMPESLDMPDVASEVEETRAVVREGERLVTARQVRSLSKAEAERRHPVTLRAVVTYYHPGWYTMFVQDETAGIYINVADQFDVKVGQRVLIDGVSGPGDFAPVVEEPVIQLLGPGTLPRPVRRDLTHLLTGQEDSHWVEVQGIVRSVVVDDGHWHLDLAQPSGRVRTSIIRDWSQEAPMHLVDAAVRVTGACASVFNQRRQLLGIQVYVPDLSHVRIEEPAGDDPFAVASQSISSLLQFDPERATGHRTKVTGVVTHVGSGNDFFVQDATGGLRVTKPSNALVEAGDEVEVVGFPALGGYAPVLEDTDFRVVGQGKRPEPVRITASQVLEGGFEEQVFDNHRVTIRGSLIDISSSNGNLTFLLQDGSHLFQTRFGVKSGAVSGQPVRLGSLVELTGVCTVQVDQHRQPVAFQIHASYPDAVTVLQAASWWAPQHTYRAMYAGGALALACVAWVTTLRRRVRQQAETIRVRLERELALKRRDRTLTRHSVVGIWQVDPEGRTIFVNPAMRRLLGVERETDFLGREADSFLPGLGALCRGGGAGLQDGVATPHEAELITASGQRRAVLASVAPIVDEAGRVESWIGTAVDITGLKRVEAELQEAKETAESASRAKSQFLANMSHEIRTPMNGVIGMINLLLRSPLNREQQDFARTVRDSAELLLSLIDDILDFSKIEAGRLALDAVDFDLREVVESCVQVLSHRAGDRGLGFGSIIGQEVPLAVRGDPTRLRQVLLNLLSNAIKFTEQGEVLLQVNLESASESGCLLRFEVHDTGIGIAPEVQRALFRPFVQADGSTTRKYGGTGLGLAISRQLVRLFRGEIGVRSEPGCGSVFWFTAWLEPAIEALDQPGGLPECFSGKRALVVDDNEVNRRIVGHHLDTWGISWDAVATPELGLERLRLDAAMNPYDVVILDMQMPGMDGLMVASRIRAEPAIAATRIILLTSLGQDLDRAGLRSLSIRECLNKPFRQEDLCNSLQRALRGPSDTALRASGCHDTTTWGAAPKPAAPARNPLLILVAEDNAVNQKVALSQLAALGYSADLVEDGVQALEFSTRKTYDVILMDCQMPRMDGYEATRRIRELEKTGPSARWRGRTNIIAMTAHAMHGDREKCLAAGMDEYLSKPLLMEELAAALEQVAARCKSYEPMAGAGTESETTQRLNPRTLDRIRSLGTASLLGEIVDLYLAEAPDLMTRMREAQQAGDSATLERAAHTLKGCSSNVGADRLASLSREVEDRCRLEGASPDEALLAALETEFEATRNALRGVRVEPD